MISPIVDNEGTTTSAGTVSAGYQNFFICLEMLCAAIALRYAFPYQVRNNQKRSLSIMLRLRIGWFNSKMNLLADLCSKQYRCSWPISDNAIDFEQFEGIYQVPDHVCNVYWAFCLYVFFFLQETMNPKDIMTDAIHNFHPQYQQYTQYSSGESTITYMVYYLLLVYVLIFVCLVLIFPLKLFSLVVCWKYSKNSRHA